MELHTIILIMQIIFIHWVADFICQSDWMALNKSSSMNALLAHTGVYSLCWFVLHFTGLTNHQVVLFVLITFVIHTTQDFLTSRVNKLLIPKREYLAGSDEYFRYKPGSVWAYFWIGVGFDQILHYGQLIFTYYFVSQLPI